MPKKKKNLQRESNQPPKEDQKLPVIEHIYELRRRLFYVAISVSVFSVLGYFVQQQLVHFLLKPSKGQQFIYTTPGGGLNFLFQVCIYFGITLSIPILIYQALKYIEPLIHHHTKRTIAKFGAWSWVLALAGAAFGYYVGLPVALNFLAHQFTTSQIKPLLTIQEYLSFVTIYLMGSALLFQIPLILLFINRIRPLPPKKLLGFERYFIAIAFVAGAIMTPTPDVFNQLLFAGPIIAVYQISILIIFFKNRRLKPAGEPARREIASLPNPFLDGALPWQPTVKPTMIVPAPRPAVSYTPRPITGISRPINRARVWDIA
jgi:sec-independent protein translocase protein TatC